MDNNNDNRLLYDEPIGNMVQEKRKVEQIVESHQKNKKIKQSSLFEQAHPTKTRVVKIRKKNGVIVQDCDVYIGRACMRGGWNLSQSKWCNPFTISKYGSAAEAVRQFEDYIMKQPKLLADIHELKGKTLGCWCKNSPSDPCHGDVLAKLADNYK